MPTIPVTDLAIGDTYTTGDPADPANSLTVREVPYPHTVTTLSGADVEVIRIPVTTNDGTELHDSAFPGDTITTNPPATKSDVVRVEVSVEHQAADAVTDVVEIDRAEWDAMAPQEREDWCVEEAEDLRANVCTSGFTVLGDVDINA